MNRFRGKFLLSDFDGTFTGSDGQIPQANIEAAKYFISEGGLFTICTGRTVQGFLKYDPGYINAPVICGNGAMAYDYARAEVVFAECIGEEAFALVREIRDRFPGVPIEMYPLGRAFVIYPNEVTERHLVPQRMPYYEVGDPAEAETPWQKIMLNTGGDVQKSAEIQKFVTAYTDDPCVIPTNGTWIEIVKRSVSKARGMFRLAEIMGVDKSEVYCCGDGCNDASMLSAAPSFCPSDGDGLAKAAAKHIGCPRDEGIVAWAVTVLEEWSLES